MSNSANETNVALRWSTTHKWCFVVYSFFNVLPQLLAGFIAGCRCKVRAYDQGSHTFYLLNQDGSLPSRQYVQMACQVRPESTGSVTVCWHTVLRGCLLLGSRDAATHQKVAVLQHACSI